MLKSVPIEETAARITRGPTSGGNPEPLAGIQDLVDEVVNSKGINAMQEDYIPTDPTNIATVRVGEELLRYVPGLIERPIADLARALRLSEAIDHRLIRRHKFGIANVVRVSLRYSDLCLNTLSPEWQPAPDLELGDPIDLPVNELAAAQKLISFDPLELLQLDEADLLALEWMTLPASSAKFNHESTSSPFGRYLRFRGTTPDQHNRWLPPTFIPEVLAHSVSELVDGLKYDNHARRALRTSCLDATRRALWSFSKTLIEAPTKSPGEVGPLIGNEIQWLVPVNESTFIAVSIIFAGDLPRSGTLSIASVQLAEQVRSHDTSEGPISARLAGGASITLGPGATVTPLVIVAGTSHLTVAQMAGQASLALEDLTWIAETATADDDLYLFARDLSSPDFPSSFGWEAIDYWEPWRSNGKTFIKGGIIPTHLSFEAHAGESEWDRAVALSRIEIGLHGAGLPALRDSQKAEISGNVASVLFFRRESRHDHQHGVHLAPDQIAWSMALITPPVAILRSHPDWSVEDAHGFLFDVCGGLVFAFDAIGESWRDAHQNLDVPGYRLLLEATEEDANQSTEIVEFSPLQTRTPRETGVALWTFDLERFVQAADGTSLAANALTAAPLKRLLEFGGVNQSVAEEIREEWHTSRPFLILETKHSQTKLHHLPSPWPLDPSDNSAATASFARRLHSLGVQPGQYRGNAANTLVKDHLAPAALKELGDRIVSHGTQTIVATGMEQLNRVMDYLQHEQGNLTRVAHNLTTDWDPVERMVELANETLQLRQCNEIIVEAALRSDGATGPQHPITAQNWSALLAAANAYRTVTVLSERLHHRVAPAIVEISSGYELTFTSDKDPRDDAWVLADEALSTAAADIRLGPTIGHDELSVDKFNDSVDAAMLESFGTTTSDLYLALVALAQWDSFEEHRSVSFASEDEVLNWVYQAVDNPDEDQRLRLQCACRMLTVSSQILRSTGWEPWQTRGRRHRLLVQPLVRRPDDSILIAPQYLLTTLSVYNHYLTQGVLPWTTDVPGPLSKALAERRSQRNLAFERALERQLQERGFETIARVKPGDQARLGVPELTTEIDLVCGRRGDPNIWLIEAKDPASVHGYAETARQLRTFFRDSQSKGRIKPSYATQLSRKESELKPYSEELAKALGVEELPNCGGHILQTRFVTRHLTPAGYLASQPYEVLTATQLFARLDEAADGLPND